MPLFAAESGAAGPPLVLLHGFGGSHAVWNRIARRASSFARVLAYDLPGHGASLDYPDAGPAKRAARAILADLDARGIARAHVAGHSMGGAIATLMAMADPGRIASLTLAAPGGFGEAINGPLLQRHAAAANAAAIRDCMAAMSGPGHAVGDDAVTASLRMRVRPGQIEKLAEILGFIVRDGSQGMIPRSALAELPMPVTVLWGTQDPVLPVSQAAGLPERFDLRLVPGAGHMLTEEAPDQVFSAIAERFTPPPRLPSG